MTKLTILIDLDDTLLENSMDTFLPNYLNLLGNSIGKKDSPKYIIQQVMLSTNMMMENNSPIKTLKEVFYENFIPSVNSEIEDMVNEIDTFYKEVYPQVKKETSPIPGAVEFVDYLEKSNYRIAIATNPLFPLTAITQRLDWANLSPLKYDFSQITSFENYHFSKPQLSYYTEILAQLGWPEGPVLMVGNDLELDILPAQKLGFATYWVTESISDPTYQETPFRGKGQISNIIEWIEYVPFKQFVPNYKNPDALISLLKGNLAAIQTLKKSLPSNHLTIKEINEGWSIGEIYLHLSDVDKDINIPRFQKIVEENDPFIEGKNPNSWITDDRYKAEKSKDLFELFSDQRIKLIAYLESISKDDWQKKGRHSIFGPINLIELVDFAGRHDRIHIRQIHQILKSNE